MKYTITQISDGEDEVILRYRSMTSEVERVFRFFDNERYKLRGYNENGASKELVLLELAGILYMESVDGKTYAYTDEAVYRVEYTLNGLERMLGDIRFFRCSKSMIINIDMVERLRSLPSNRIDATMRNGEHIMISRTYASDFRKRLRGGAHNE